MDTFKEAAGFGEKKDIKGTSASIYVGKRAQIGTGFSDQFMDTSKFKDLEEEMSLNPDMKLDIGEFKDAAGLSEPSLLRRLATCFSLRIYALLHR